MRQVRWRSCGTDRFGSRFIRWGLASSQRALAAPPRHLRPISSGWFKRREHDFTSGNYLSRSRLCNRPLSQSPSSAEAYYWLARSYYELRDFDNAVVHAEKAVALDTKNSLYHQWLGRAYGGKADRDRSFFLAKKVKKELQEAVRLNPSNIAARMDLEEFCTHAPWIVGGSKEEAREPGGCDRGAGCHRRACGEGVSSKSRRRRGLIWRRWNTGRFWFRSRTAWSHIWK